MADIAKCMGTHCPQRETCFRHIVQDGKDQHYMPLPIKPNGECVYYWDIAAFRGKSK